MRDGDISNETGFRVLLDVSALLVPKAGLVPKWNGILGKLLHKASMLERTFTVNQPLVRWIHANSMHASFTLLTTDPNEAAKALVLVVMELSLPCNVVVLREVSRFRALLEPPRTIAFSNLFKEVYHPALRRWDSPESLQKELDSWR